LQSSEHCSNFTAQAIIIFIAVHVCIIHIKHWVTH